MKRRYGVLTFAGGPFSEIADCWRMVEERGFDSAWLVDTFSYGGLVEHEPWTLLGGLARETSRLRIGTLITQIAFRHPTLLAAQALTVDRLSGGRIELGIGGGSSAADHAAVGAGSWSPVERLARLAEQLAMLDPLLRGTRLDFAGEFYQAAGAQLPAPVQRPRPPLVIAAQSQGTLRLAAQFGDAWNTLGGQPQTETGLPRRPLREAVERTRRQGQQLDNYCHEFGRDARAIRRSVLALRADPNPLSSIDAFDEFVGSYAGIGITEFIFYWPPPANLRRREPITAPALAAFNRIAADRIALSRA